LKHKILDPTTAPLTQADIAAGLRGLGVLAGAGVMVHSSLKSFGHVEGGAGAVVAALMEVVTADGTLLLPTFNHDVPFHEAGPGYYDPRETPTINGAIPDAFWRLPGVQRSLDPTHPIAAWGRNATRYTEAHHRTLTMGPQSPLGLLCAEGGYGLLLGVTYSANTFHHVVEMSTRAPCLGQRSEAYPVRLADGRTVLGRTWGWRERGCPITDATRYAAAMEPLQRQVRIGGCTATFFRLQDCYDVIAPLLREGLGKYPPCSRCPVRPRRVPQTVPSDWDADAGQLLPDSVAWTY
jgi:aminoglycoside N3'-acetyltransferase